MHRFRIALHSPTITNLESKLVLSCVIHLLYFLAELLFARAEA